MDDVILRSIENEFGVTLPQEYVSFMRNYPKILDDTKCKFGPDSEEAISARYFLKSATAIREENRMIRQALPDGEVVWPRRYFVIGSTDIGDIYVIDCDAGNSAVWLWNHEEDVFDPISDDIAGFADFIVQDVRDWNAETFPTDETNA